MGAPKKQLSIAIAGNQAACFCPIFSVSTRADGEDVSKHPGMSIVRRVTDRKLPIFLAVDVLPVFGPARAGIFRG
jgi:hypothetical protein